MEEEEEKVIGGFIHKRDAGAKDFRVKIRTSFAAAGN